MPRLTCTFERFRQIIEEAGFVLHRHDGTNHRRYRREVNGEVFLVDMSPHSWGDHIKPKTLNSMIRQSGLPKTFFRHL